MLSDVVLFGVGNYAGSYLHMLQHFGTKVLFFVDNDRNKIGSNFEGMEIKSPTRLIGLDCKIIISCMRIKEITEQLDEYGISDRIITLLEYLAISNNTRRYLRDNDTKIVLDLYSKASWGGAENWNLNLAKELSAKEYPVEIVASDNVMLPKSKNELFPIHKIKRKNNFGSIVDYYKSKEKLIFVNSFFDDSFFAAVAMKHLEPQKMKIISIVHNDFEDLYSLCLQFESVIDCFICVSSKIRETLVKKFKIHENKVFFIPQPIQYDKYFVEVRQSDGPLKIGIASRITQKQKRSDLIIPFIQELEKSTIDYILEIAGDGELLESICFFVGKNNIENKVKILGHIDKEEMALFWERQDIFVSFSDFEGTSLSMLEAMSYGCVPLVTDVSGVSDFIVNSINGWVCDSSKMESYVKKIIYLDKAREQLWFMGKAARTMIESKCDFAEYAEKFMNCLSKEKIC